MGAKHCFNYPEDKSLLNVSVIKINSCLLLGDYTLEEKYAIVQLLKVLQEQLKHPEMLMSSSSKEYLRSLLITTQLKEPLTTSVEYVNGELKYCVKQNLNEYLFSPEFYVDKLNDFKTPVIILKNLVTGNNSEFDNNTRIKILKKCKEVLNESEFDIAKVYVNTDCNKRLNCKVSTVDGIGLIEFS
jgi:hypothetical protein